MSKWRKGGKMRDITGYACEVSSYRSAQRWDDLLETSRQRLCVREVLSCGHLHRIPELYRTVDKMAALFHELDGTTPRRICMQCKEKPNAA